MDCAGSCITAAGFDVVAVGLSAGARVGADAGGFDLTSGAERSVVPGEIGLGETGVGNDWAGRTGAFAAAAVGSDVVGGTGAFTTSAAVGSDVAGRTGAFAASAAGGSDAAAGTGIFGADTDAGTGKLGFTTWAVDSADGGDSSSRGSTDFICGDET